MLSEKLASYDSRDFAAVLCEKGTKDRWAQGLLYTKGSFSRAPLKENSGKSF